MRIDRLFDRKHTADCKRVRPTRAIYVLVFMLFFLFLTDRWILRPREPFNSFRDIRQIDSQLKSIVSCSGNGVTWEGEQYFDRDILLMTVRFNGNLETVSNCFESASWKARSEHNYSNVVSAFCKGRFYSFVQIVKGRYMLHIFVKRYKSDLVCKK